jgi:4-hydroxy-2-oxoheptanedioate aldolase
MEHNPYDVSALGDSLQYLLNRKQIATAGSWRRQVTPLARIPANGVEMNQSFAKQVLDRGVYGVIWPHVATVEQAYNAVASCRYARPKNAPLYEPKGVRGDGPANAARYWGLSQAEYYAKADVWPLAPQGEILVGLMIESTQAIENLDDILANVPGIGFVLIGEGDLSQELGLPRQYEHPEVLDAMRRSSPRPATSTTSWSATRTCWPKNYERAAQGRLQLPDVGEGPAAQLRRGRQGARHGGVLR